MATIEKREDQEGNISYRVKIRLKGYPPETATFKRLTDAKRWVQKTEAAIREGKYFKTSEARNRTLEELIDRYKKDRLPLRGRDKETVGPQLDWWRSKLGKYCLFDITPVMIADHRDKLLTEPMRKKGEEKEHMLSKGTVIRYLASLSVCFTYAERDLGWIESNPVKAVNKPKASRGRERFLTAEEREKLLVECKDSTSSALYPVVVIAIRTGARLSEITGLRWKDVDLKRKVMRLEETKNGEKRAVPLVEPVCEVFRELMKVQRIDTDLIFAREDGLASIDLRKTFARTATRAGLTGFRFHDLRHTAASYLAMDGASLLDIANILGHKTLSMVKRYSHFTDQHTASVLERMNERQFKEAK
jgi:integrase